MAARLNLQSTMVMLLAVVGVLGCASPAATPDLVVTQVNELGVVSKPTSVKARDVGASALIGSRLLWVFGDTLFNPASVDGSNLRSSTAAWADPTQPLTLSEPVDANGAPQQFLPFTAEETQFNASTGTPQDRIAVWSGAPITVGVDEGIVWYLKTHIRPGFLNYEHLGVGLARIKSGQTTATREPELLFGPTEPLFVNPARFGDWVYLYGNAGHGAGNRLMLARVPLTQVGQRGAYEFWTGTGWSQRLESAVALFGNVPGELSVSYNPHLGAYLAVYADVLAGQAVARLASQPQGPWGPAVNLFKMRAAQTQGFSYAAREHPHLSRDGGRTLFITYYQPLTAFTGELRAVTVSLR